MGTYAERLGAAQRSVLRVFRVLAAPTGEVVCGPDTACAIAFWTRVGGDGVPRSDGATHLPGTHLAPTTNGVVRYVTEPLWRRAISSPSHWPVEHSRPDLFEVPEPVDIVYTWVDGADPSWRSRSPVHSPDPAAALDRSATSLARYLNRDELRYSMRSVAMYAGWVRRIFLVTDGQIPGWLDTTHPKVTVVDHRDIFADPGALPVFNSHAIESQLHHIDGLPERYLYPKTTCSSAARCFLSCSSTPTASPSSCSLRTRPSISPHRRPAMSPPSPRQRTCAR